MMCLRATCGQIVGVFVSSTTVSVLDLPAVTQALDATSRLMLPSHGLAFVEVRPH